MLFSKTVLLSLALSLINAASIPIEKRDGPKVLAFDLTISRPLVETNTTIQLDDATIKELGVNKAKTESITLQNLRSYYSLDLQLGSNKQKFSVDIDTGSSDLWVVSSNAAKNDPDLAEYGTYDSSSSSTYKSTNQPFGIRYLDQTHAEGSYVLDDVWLPSGDRIKQFEFGNAITSTTAPGVLGIGFQSNEATNSAYDNFPIALKKQGLIDTIGYSLYLDQLNDETGKIIFGGYDTTKYSGNLVELPFTSTREFTVKLNNVVVNGVSFPINGDALLDSGTTLSYLPTAAYKAINQKLGKYSAYYGRYLWDCNQPTDKYITYNFNGVSIKIDYASLVWPLYTNSGFTGKCSAGIADGGDSTILGDTFLRSAYLVYNLEKKTVKIAQSAHSDKSNIVAI